VTALTISNLVLWVLQIATIVVVVGLARQVGVLHLRVKPLSAGLIEDGPPIGARLELPPVVSLRGEQTPVVIPGYLSLVTFANPGCSACGPTMEAVKRLRSVEREVRFVVAVDGDQTQGLRYASSYGLTDVVGSDSLRTMSCASRPFTVVVSDEGTVLATGVPNTLEQLEMLLANARHGYASGDDSDETVQHPSFHDADAVIPVIEPSLTDYLTDIGRSRDHAE
jgi:methylamine dehydrogenase accessory protein MauD